MMKSAGILDKYSDVLAEFPEVVRAGGGWTSVTPGSQQYWLQAFNNVLHGRWEKIDAGYGKSILGYFGRPPLPPDPEVVKIAAEKLELPPFDGDPLEEAPDTLVEAEAALKERGLEVTDENKFLVAAAIVPGKNMELNEGIRLLENRPKITLPLKKDESDAPAAATITAPTKTSVTVTEVKPGPTRWSSSHRYPRQPLSWQAAKLHRLPQAEMQRPTCFHHSKATSSWLRSTSRSATL